MDPKNHPHNPTPPPPPPPPPPQIQYIGQQAGGVRCVAGGSPPHTRGVWGAAALQPKYHNWGNIRKYCNKLVNVMYIYIYKSLQKRYVSNKSRPQRVTSTMSMTNLLAACSKSRGRRRHRVQDARAGVYVRYHDCQPTRLRALRLSSPYGPPDFSYSNQQSCAENSRRISGWKMSSEFSASGSSL